MWTWRRKRDAELSAELESHLDMHVADNVRAAMTPEEARRQARIALAGAISRQLRQREDILAASHHASARPRLRG